MIKETLKMKRLQKRIKKNVVSGVLIFTHLNGLDLPEIFKRLSHGVVGDVFGQMPHPQCCTADWREGQTRKP